jgi:hypothetical protein
VTELLHVAWILDKVLSYGGLAVALAGVAIFGWHFVLINARAARAELDKIPGTAWRGKGAKLGFRLLATGVAMQVASFVLAMMLRNGF